MVRSAWESLPIPQNICREVGLSQRQATKRLGLLIFESGEIEAGVTAHIRSYPPSNITFGYEEGCVG